MALWPFFLTHTLKEMHIAAVQVLHVCVHVCVKFLHMCVSSGFWDRDVKFQISVLVLQPIGPVNPTDTHTHTQINIMKSFVAAEVDKIAELFNSIRYTIHTHTFCE